MVHLGVRVRDALYRRPLFVGPVRRVLHDSVMSIPHTPERVAAALDQVRGLLDTWPLAAMVDIARKAWTEGPDADALAVLARATEVMGPVLGWPRSIDRRWPMPDMEWMQEQLEPDVSYAVVPCGPRDGAMAVSVALDLPLAPAEPLDLPERLRLPGDELATRLDEILAQADRIAAVEWHGYLPHDSATHHAQVALRSALPRQEGFDSHGLAGLVAGSVPQFEQLLGKAPPGAHGDRLHAVAEALIVPTLGSGDAVTEAGVLVWDAPYKPVYVHPSAVHILHQLDGRRDVDAVAAEVGSPPGLVGAVLRQLVELGAATAG